MSWAVEVESARRSVLRTGHLGSAHRNVRADVLASWERSYRYGVPTVDLTPPYVAGEAGPTGPQIPGDVHDEFLRAIEDTPCCLVFLTAAGVVRDRWDCDTALAHVLDDLLVVPGYDYSEKAVGTTAISIALETGSDRAVRGPEHYSTRLSCISEAAAVVAGADQGEICGVVDVITHDADASSLQLSLARLVARQLSERLAGDPGGRAVLDGFRRVRASEQEGVLATDGDTLIVNGVARTLDDDDRRALTDLLFGHLGATRIVDSRLQLPSGTSVELRAEPVHHEGAPVGCVLRARPVGSEHPAIVVDPMRRQGSHVAPMTQHDYARQAGERKAARRSTHRREQTTLELLTPFVRARYEVAASMKQRRNHLLTGESGVGKGTLVLSQFRSAFPGSQAITVDSTSLTDESPAVLDDRQRLERANPDGGPNLLLIRDLNLMSPVVIRRLDEVVRPLMRLPSPPLVVGCIDDTSVDATRPYGLLLRYFEETTRVPALRYRLDEIADIAQSVLHKIAVRRSLRLSFQVVRVLEGYAWPGNISELEDVMRYVLERKPVGEVQPRDLPPVCFQSRSRRLTMLEAAQCDAIIQALYESRGNRYKAAAMLGIARSSLYRKIDAFGISYIA